MTPLRYNITVKLFPKSSGVILNTIDKWDARWDQFTFGVTDQSELSLMTIFFKNNIK